MVKQKRGERDGDEWLIGAHTQNIGTQDKKKVCKTFTDESKVEKGPC